MSKKLVLVVCGAGTLTSLMAKQGIEEGLSKRKVTNVEVKTGRIDDIERFKNEITILVSTMNIRSEYPFPVIRATCFLTGDEEAQEEIIDKVATYLD